MFVTSPGVEVSVLYLDQAVLEGEGIGPFADHEDVFGALHNNPRRADGIADAPYAANRAGGESASVHDRGVELVLAIAGVDGTVPGIEERMILQRNHGLGHRVERAAAIEQNMLAGAHRPGEPGVVALR